MTSSPVITSFRHQLLNVDAWLLVAALFLPSLLLFPSVDKASVPLRLVFGLIGLVSLVRTPAALGRAVRSWPLWLFLAYVATALTSTALNDFPDKALRGLLLTGAVFMGFYAFSLRWPAYRQTPFILCGATLVATLLLTSPIGDLLSTLGISMHSTEAWLGSRFIGLPGLHPATLGWLCAVLGVFLYTSASFRASFSSRSGLLFLSFALLFFLCLTWSRTYMATAFGLCALFAFLHTRADALPVRLRTLGLLLLPLACLAVFYGTFTSVETVQQTPVVQEQPVAPATTIAAQQGGRFTDPTTWYSRLYIWEAAWDAFLSKPWLGNGVNSTPLTHKAYWSTRSDRLVPGAFETRATHAHNYVLHFLSEGGILGFAAMTAFLAACLLSARNAPPFFWSTLAILAMSIMDLFMASRYHATLSFALLGCIAALKRAPEDG